MVGRYYIQHALLVAYVQNAEVMLNTRASKTWQVFFWERDFILQKREVSNYIFSSTQKPCAASNEFSIKGRIIFIEPASRQSTHGTYMKVYKPHQKRFIHPTVKLKFIDDRGFLIQMKRNMMWNKFCLLIFLWQWWNVCDCAAASAQPYQDARNHSYCCHLFNLLKLFFNSFSSTYATTTSSTMWVWNFFSPS